MKAIFSSSRNKIPHNNEGKEHKETPFFSKESRQPFFTIPNGGVVQTKLTVGEPGDKYEKEADSMADAVVNKSISKPAIQNKEISSIQRESLATPLEDEKLGTAEQRMEEDKLIQEKPEIQRMEHPEEEMLNKMDNEEEEPIQKMGMAGTDKDEELQAKSNSSTPNTASAAVANKISSKSGKGKRMSNQTKAEMEGSFGVDFSNVNIHTDQTAVSLNKELGAQAFTHGNDVFFNSGKYNPDSSQGKHLLAHELTHVIQQDKKSRLKVQKRGESHGQSATGSSRHLISDLTTPITVGSAPRFELIQHGAELWNPDTEVTYRWSITDNTSGNVVFKETTTEPTTRIRASRAGNYTVNVTVLGNGQPAATSITMNQTVEAEDSFLTTNLSGATDGQASTYRELVNDFRPYINDGATATGANGITPRFLASVLFIEVLNRPKEGREDELEGVGEAIGDLQQGEGLYPWQKVDRSIGVGQIKSSTAAMVMGTTPWVDQERGDRAAGRERTESNYEALSADQKAAIFQILRWPKSNIAMAARLLATLKNRANRFPTLTRSEFGNDEHAVGVIASEYNLGPSDTLADDARASWYGRNVWDSMNNDTILRNYFNNL